MLYRLEMMIFNKKEDIRQRQTVVKEGESSNTLSFVFTRHFTMKIKSDRISPLLPFCINNHVRYFSNVYEKPHPLD